MTTTGKNGRLCNQIIRNIAVSLIAEKNDLYVNYCNKELIVDSLGIKLFSGKKQFDNTILLTDGNYFDIYNSPELQSNLNPNNDYFQTKAIINLVYNYLQSLKENIIQKNPFNNRFNNNNDLIIHIRLTDVARFNPGINYYLETIQTITFDKLYITTDDKSHNIIKQIIAKYPETIIVNFNEVKTIQFASTCKNIILSHGTFSACIGYLAFSSIVHYPKYDTNNMWHGDIFSINNWIEHS